MTCDAGSLRAFLRATGPDALGLMLEAVDGGVVMDVVVDDQVVRVADRESALALLASTSQCTPERVSGGESEVWRLATALDAPHDIGMIQHLDHGGAA